jgi:hypothetical protein
VEKRKSLKQRIINRKQKIATGLKNFWARLVAANALPTDMGKNLDKTLVAKIHHNAE